MKIKINSFEGPYRFLSNFWMYTVVYEGIAFPSSEHAYQAAKTLDIEKRKQIADCRTAGDSKRAGRKLSIRPDWEEVKYKIMVDILTSKFKKEPIRSWLKTQGRLNSLNQILGMIVYGECVFVLNAKDKGRIC